MNGASALWSILSDSYRLYTTRLVCWLLAKTRLFRGWCSGAPAFPFFFFLLPHQALEFFRQTPFRKLRVLQISLLWGAESCIHVYVCMRMNDVCERERERAGCWVYGAQYRGNHALWPHMTHVVISVPITSTCWHQLSLNMSFFLCLK